MVKKLKKFNFIMIKNNCYKCICEFTYFLSKFTKRNQKWSKKVVLKYDCSIRFRRVHLLTLLNNLLALVLEWTEVETVLFLSSVIPGITLFLTDLIIIIRNHDGDRHMKSITNLLASNNGLTRKPTAGINLLRKNIS